jgi:hypothetical protein
MSRESAETKSLRYLAEARLTVEHVTADGVRASCRGSGALYVVTWTQSEGWQCSCPAFGRCAHLLALQAVTVRPECFTGG